MPTLPLLVAGCFALAALSLILPSPPGKDPWAWIIWGREVAHFDLDTMSGSSWKPLPVLLTTPFSVFGDAAPQLWILVVRAGALLAVLFAVRVASRPAAPAAGAAGAGVRQGRGRRGGGGRRARGMAALCRAGQRRAAQRGPRAHRRRAAPERPPASGDGLRRARRARPSRAVALPRAVRAVRLLPQGHAKTGSDRAASGRAGAVARRRPVGLR